MHFLNNQGGNWALVNWVGLGRRTISLILISQESERQKKKESKRQKKFNQWNIYAMTLTFDGEYYCNQNVFSMSVLLKNMRSEYVYFQAEVPTKFEFISVCWMSPNYKSSDSQRPERSGPHNVSPKITSASSWKCKF